MSYPQGLDVASYQGPHPDVSGATFVFVKATEGLGYVNPDWTTQLAGARAAGAVVGFYHFPHAGQDLAAQVQFMLTTLGPALRPGDMLSLDWETNPADGSYLTGAAKDQFLAILGAKAPAHRRVLYCNLDFWRNHDTTSNAGDGLWIADPDSPPGSPRVAHPWVFHQYGQRADGTDVNVANFPDAAALRAWASGAPPSTTPGVDMALTPTDADLLLNTPVARAGQAGQTSLAAFLANNDVHVQNIYDQLAAITGKIQAPPAVDVAALAAALEPLLATGPTADQVAAAVLHHLSADTAAG